MVGWEGNEPKQGGVGRRRLAWWLWGILRLEEGGRGGKEILFGFKAGAGGGGGRGRAIIIY